MIKLEDMRRVLNMTEEEETEFFEAKDQIEALLEAIDSAQEDPNFYTIRNGILDEIKHIVETQSPILVPFLLVLAEQGAETEFRSSGDSEE